ncbi:MAG: Methyltransferase type 11 [Ktedonobacterales bacterium]|nr:MAG: Methyltransferase type 11 [Ktedonobacterales bacterium]
MPLFRRRPRIVTDSVSDRRFFVFGGRRHLAALPYPLPKDLAEINRLDFQHYLLRTGLRGNYAAPLQNPTSILDVGCGSSRWALEVASIFPSANVVGLDLVPPAVSDAQLLGNGLERRPDNYSFTAGNILEGLPFADRSFDFVHQRLLITAIPKERWPYVVQELVRVTRPGGWVELAECGVPEDGGPGYTGLWNTWIQFCAKRGVDFTIGHTTADMLRAGGMSHASRHMLRFPMGAHGGHVGRMSATDCLAVGSALRAGVIGQNIMSAEEYDRLYALAQSEFADPRGKGVLPFYVSYGQRLA